MFIGLCEPYRERIRSLYLAVDLDAASYRQAWAFDLMEIFNHIIPRDTALDLEVFVRGCDALHVDDFVDDQNSVFSAVIYSLLQVMRHGQANVALHLPDFLLPAFEERLELRPEWILGRIKLHELDEGGHVNPDCIIDSDDEDYGYVEMP
jgi:hypothetical protein